MVNLTQALPSHALFSFRHGSGVTFAKGSRIILGACDAQHETHDQEHLLMCRRAQTGWRLKSQSEMCLTIYCNAWSADDSTTAFVLLSAKQHIQQRIMQSACHSDKATKEAWTVQADKPGSTYEATVAIYPLD